MTKRDPSDARASGHPSPVLRPDDYEVQSNAPDQLPTAAELTADGTTTFDHDLDESAAPLADLATEANAPVEREMLGVQAADELRDLVASLESQRQMLYAERNLLACAVVALTERSGRFHAGWRPDPDEGPDWPILYLDTPAGQLSWHIPKEVLQRVLPTLRQYPRPWDEHTTPEKLSRIERLILTGPRLS